MKSNPSNYSQFDNYSTTRCGSAGVKGGGVIRAPVMVSLPFQTLFRRVSNPLSYYVPLQGSNKKN